MPLVRANALPAALCRRGRTDGSVTSRPQSDDGDGDVILLPHWSAEDGDDGAATAGQSYRSATLLTRAIEASRTASVGAVASIADLERIIRSANGATSDDARGEFSLDGLATYFDPDNGHLEETEIDCFFAEILPAVMRMALGVSDVFASDTLPILRPGCTRSLTLSTRQVDCLMANAFLSTIPVCKSTGKATPNINMNHMFRLLPANAADSQAARPKGLFEKVKCLLNYFRIAGKRWSSSPSESFITYRRLAAPPVPDSSNSSKGNTWSRLYHVPFSDSQDPLTTVHVHTRGTIEDDGVGMLQVDFANSLVGGGTLSWGAVQEEILFAIAPQLTVARLLCPDRMRDNEVITVTGFERFSNYTGYGQSFAFDGSHVNADLPHPATLDESTRHLTTMLVAMDAVDFSRRTETQYDAKWIDRELTKARMAFAYENDDDDENNDKLPTAPSIATGNWGCGVFSGDRQLKFLIQWMAASVASSGRRSIAYFTFGNERLSEQLRTFHDHIQSVSGGVTVQKMYTLTHTYCEWRKTNGGRHNNNNNTQSAFDFITECLQDVNSSISD